MTPVCTGQVLQGYVVEHLGDPEAVLVVDETGFLKEGRKSVGVKRQYSGTGERWRTVRSGCFWPMAAVTAAPFWIGSCIWPRSGRGMWSVGEKAGVPEGVSFRTKGQLAQTMIARGVSAGALWLGGWRYGVRQGPPVAPVAGGAEPALRAGSEE